MTQRLAARRGRAARGLLAGLLSAASGHAAGAGADRPLIDDTTLQREYQSYRQSLEGMQRYGVRYLVVATEDEARQVIARIRSGGDFAEIARRQSLHADSAARGGDLGVHAGCRWARDTVAMLDALAPGQLHPKPVRTSQGWGVYRLESKVAIVPRPFERYREELLANRFEPECPWQPPVTIAPAGPARP